MKGEASEYKIKVLIRQSTDCYLITGLKISYFLHIVLQKKKIQVISLGIIFLIKTRFLHVISRLSLAISPIKLRLIGTFNSTVIQ